MRTLHQTRGKIETVKAQAQEILGSSWSHFLTAAQRSTLYRIGYSFDPITAKDKYAIDQIANALARRAA